MKDLDDVTRDLYRQLRRKGSTVVAGEAWMIYRRTSRATFIAGPDGVMPSKLQRLAELRVLAQRQWPLGFCARFDR